MARSDAPHAARAGRAASRTTVTAHPPWLRFQAYAVGLPRSGSTSLAALFGRYRTGHEWQLMELVGPAMARRRGELGDEEFLRATSGRLVPPALEMDSATCHHLYADLLSRTFPGAVFLLAVRDVRSWVSSFLDMVLRQRIAFRLNGTPRSRWHDVYLPVLTEGAYDIEGRGDDRASLPPLMRSWAAHLREMTALLPADRSLRVRTRDIGSRLPEIAALVGVPTSTLRAELSHANRAAHRFDRFAAFDGEELRATYDESCAELMKELFPEEHAAWTAREALRDGGAVDWPTHLARVEAWVARAIESHAPGAAR